LRNQSRPGEVVEAAAERLIHRDRARVADERARRIEVADHPLVFRLQQIGPRARHRLAVQRILVHEEAERARVDREPVALRVLQVRGDVVPVRGPVRRDHALVLRLERRRHAEIDDVGDRAFCSAISCAIAWPEFLLSNGTRMPVFCLIAAICAAQSAHSGGQL
jgi:hypothetical protein